MGVYLTQSVNADSDRAHDVGFIRAQQERPLFFRVDLTHGGAVCHSGGVPRWAAREFFPSHRISEAGELFVPYRQHGQMRVLEVVSIPSILDAIKTPPTCHQHG